MFILGLLAFLQTTFIPGYILIKYLGFERDRCISDKIHGKIPRLVYAFGLSLGFNYLLVFFSTSIGMYTPLTLYFVLFIEAVLIIHYHWKQREPGNRFTLDFNRIVDKTMAFIASRSLTENFLLFGAFAVILIHIFYFFYFLGSVFEHWDPVLNWNRYAAEWSANGFPTRTWRYPQLIPANWSISYTLMQNTTVQVFARCIMPLFSIASLLLFLDLGLRKKAAQHGGVYFLAAIIYGLLLNLFYDPSFIVSGYVDIAVSFFAFLAFHVLHSLKDSDTGTERSIKVVFLAVIFASFAAVTKQAGFFMLAYILVSVLVDLVKNKKAYSFKKPAATVILLLVTVLVVSGSWYIFKEVQIRSGADNSEIGLVQSANKTTDYGQRFTNALDRLASHRHPRLKYIVYFFLLLMIPAFFNKRARAVTAFIAVPYFLLWGFFFSYDNRNLAFAIPFIAFSAAAGLDFLKGLLPGPGKLPRVKIPIIPVIVGFIALPVIINVFVVPNGTLIDHQTQQRMNVGNDRLNQMLYDFHKKEGITGKIATDYAYLQFLPELGQYYKQRNGRISREFLEYLDTPDGQDINYLLMPMLLPFEVELKKYFREKLETKQYKLIFKLGTYRFVQIRSLNDPKIK